MSTINKTGFGGSAALLSTLVVGRLLALRDHGLPSAVAQAVQLHCADALAIALAARAHPVAGSVIRAQADLSGDGPCRLIGGGTSAAGSAAFINAALIHILDYDDIHDVGRLHPGAVILPAVLAAADLSGADDRVVTEAVAVATELICRLGVLSSPQGDGPGSEWFLTQLFGYVAASVGASLALGLTSDQLVSAIGLAYMQMAGGKQAGFGIGANARAIYPAFAAQGGLQAALLARSGMVGPEGAMDGAANMFRIYLGGDLPAAQVSRLLNDDCWHCLDVDIKPWPSCRLSHPYVSVALSARKAISTAPITRVQVGVNASAARLCMPLAQRRVPTTLQDAKYSIPFMSAFALVRGAPTLQNLDDAVLHDQQVLDMAQLVEVVQTLPDNPGHPLATLVIHLADGTTHTQTFSPDDLRMDQEVLQQKFLQCFAHAGRSELAHKAWCLIMEGKLQRGLDAAGAQA